MKERNPPSMSKKESRALFNSLLKEKTADSVFCQAAARAACTALEQSPLFTGASVLFAFHSLKTEIPAMQILHAALKCGKQVALPRIRNTTDEIDFYYLNPQIPLEKQVELHPFGMKEPQKTLQKAELANIPPNAAVLVPGVAFSKDGKRLGHGKGYYDRFIARLENAQPHAGIPLIGVCFSFQITDNLPAEAHDRRVTHLLTEKGLFETSL